MITALGRAALQTVRTAGKLTLFGGGGLRSIIGARRLSRKFLSSVHELGVRCLPVILSVAFFTGLVLALQLYYILARFTAESMLGPGVSLALVRELGPVLTALMIVGQAGSALTSELGNQRNAEQVDALENMGIPPLAFLVGPRLLAALFCFPILTAVFNLVGIFGGWITCVFIVPFDGGLYLNTMKEAVDFADVRHSLTKALVFGFVTILICTFQGYFVHELSKRRGVKGVSESTTRAVVWCSIAILFFNFVLTALLINK